MAKKEQVSQGEETKASTAPDRFIEIDGIQVNFGKRANLLTSIDEAANTVIFKLFTGKVINWTVPFVDGLSGFVKSVYIYGLVSKIKSSLAPVKLDDLEAAIGKAIVSLDSGILTARVSTVGTLSDEQKAYALVKSTVGNRHYEDQFAHWNFLANPVVVQEVLAAWASFDKSKRNAIRRDPYVSLEKAQLEAAKAPESAII